MKPRIFLPITDDDRRLFRETIGEVQRLDPVASPPAAGRPAPHPRMLEADEAAVPGELLDMAFDPALLEVGEELSYLRDGYPLRTHHPRQGPALEGGRPGAEDSHRPHAAPA